MSAPQDPAGAPEQRGQTVLVAFSSVEEFLDELRERGPNVDGALRLTFRWQPDSSGLPISDLWVLANYLRRLEPGGPLAIVRFEQYAGAVWSGVDDKGSAAARQRVEAVRTRIQEAAAALGIEVRAGTHQAP